MFKKYIIGIECLICLQKFTEKHLVCYRITLSFCYSSFVFFFVMKTILKKRLSCKLIIVEQLIFKFQKYYLNLLNNVENKIISSKI